MTYEIWLAAESLQSAAPSNATYGLNDWTTRATDRANRARRLSKVCCTDIFALVLVVLLQEKFAIPLQRVVDASGDFLVVQEKRSISSAARGGVLFVLG